MPKGKAASEKHKGKATLMLPTVRNRLKRFSDGRQLQKNNTHTNARGVVVPRRAVSVSAAGLPPRLKSTTPNGRCREMEGTIWGEQTHPTNHPSSPPREGSRGDICDEVYIAGQKKHKS